MSYHDKINSMPLHSFPLSCHSRMLVKMYRTWSKYLLEEKFDQDSQRNFEGGRYRSVVIC